MSEDAQTLIRAVVRRHFRRLAGRPVLSEQVPWASAELRNRLDAGAPPGSIAASGRKAMAEKIQRERGMKK